MAFLSHPNVSHRTASYYWGSEQQLYRNLLKLYGIRFDLSVHGQVLGAPHPRADSSHHCSHSAPVVSAALTSPHLGELFISSQSSLSRAGENSLSYLKKSLLVMP